MFIISLHQILFSRSKQISKQIQSIKSKIALLPPGHLRWSHNGKYIKWIHALPGGPKYISKKDSFLAEKLAQKQFLSLMLADLQEEQIAVDACLSHYSNYVSKAEQFLATPSVAQQLFQNSRKIPNPTLQDWFSAPYERNQTHPEHLIHKTGLGFNVRSKSESLIALLLHQYNIPFHYEEKLLVGGSTFYPDFTVRHPKTGEFLYIEHLGMMDVPSYRQKAFNKLQIYISHGIIPFVNLIITFETKDYPLDLALVEMLIRYYFCEDEETSNL